MNKDVLNNGLDVPDFPLFPRRYAPHWHTLMYCRHIGVQRHPNGTDFWVARVRLKTGSYRQRRIGQVASERASGLSFDRAITLATQWFEMPETAAVASRSYPKGNNQELRYISPGGVYTIGDAMADYVAWKRIAAAKSHFDANLSLINHHIIPRLGNVPAAKLTPKMLTDFTLDVLETPPKYGNRPLGPKTALAGLSSEQLRKRKKTVNTLLGIIKLALEMAWENGEIESERVWRSIRRLPHKDVPRHLFLSRPECSRLLSKCRADLRKLVLGGLYTGCRVSELSDLQVQDFSLERNSLFVASGKNNLNRHVQLPSEAKSFFMAECRGRKPRESLFLMSSGRRWRGQHKHLFKAAVVAARLPTNFVFHGLRHTYASQLVQAGMPLMFVARQLGHVNTDTVSRTYGHLSSQEIEREVERHFAPILGASDQLSRTSENRNEEGGRPGYGSWPHANFSRSANPILDQLRDR